MEERVPSIRPKLVDVMEPWDIRDRLCQVGWHQSRLASADYIFYTHNYKKVGIERKEVSDLLNSIGKRLGNQMSEMLNLFDFKILLIEGSWKQAASHKIMTDDGLTRWGMSIVWNYIRSWQDRGVTIELTSSIGHTIRRVNELYAYYQKPYHVGSINSHQYSDERVLAFPSGCRGKTAMNVLEKYGNLARICTVNEKEFTQIDKIGDKKAALIYSHFHKDGNK